MKKTKIVCTMGPQEENLDLVIKLIEAGMDVARFNFSHGTHEEHLARMNVIRQAREQTGKPVAMLLDTKGPEIRTGLLEDGQKVELVTGKDIILTCDDCVGNAERVSVSYKNLCNEVKPGTIILVDDGLMELEVKEVNGADILCRINNGGMLSERKGCNIPGVSIGLPAVTEQDIDDIVWGIANGFDMIAASFIRNAEAVKEIKTLVKSQGSSVPVYSKIECAEALDNIDDIIRESDGIMVARGDLGVEIPSFRVPHIQKKIIDKCNQDFKPVITATQMLDSMIRNPRPTRAEVTDVANAIYDGTDAIMLSGETAVGKYPVEAVTLMNQIAVDSEAHLDERHFTRYRSMLDTNTISSSVCYAAVATAKTLHAKAIIIPTISGTTARLMSNFRPDIPIYAVSPIEEMVRRMQVYWGVTPIKGKKERNQYLLVDHAIEACKKNGFVEEGDLIVVTAGDPVSDMSEDNMSVTNMMSVYVVD